MAVVALGCACPPINSTPCATDDQCRADQRCRRGACGPICLDDAECGSGQTCQAGVCAQRPECTDDTQCAVGFACASGRCRCTADTSCSANQSCINGTCQSQPRCTSDAECLSVGGRCEVTQGLCLPVCTLAQDCAPTLDPNLAFVLYACVQGTCTRHCTTDLLCGGAGFICQNGLCAVAQCKTKSECPSGQYCTSATTGRCQAFQTCSASTQCQRNFECRPFTAAQCPPGFDCAQAICQELPTCLADGDCVTGVPGTMGFKQTGFCEEGHCQSTSSCTTSPQCQLGRECVGGLCVPSVCRGSCPANQACVDGACVSAPVGGDVAVAKLRPERATLVVGDTLQLTLVGYGLDGTSFPTAVGDFTVVDGAGQPSTLASVTPQGLVTGLAPGPVTVRAHIPGSVIAPVETAIIIYPRITVGRRVVVLDAATGAPISGAQVRGCLTTCADAPTQSDGVALFPSMGPEAATFTATSTSLRSDGLPAFERASIIGTRSADVAIALRDNPVRGRGGFSASVSFSSVSTVGNYWAGFVTASTTDLLSVTPASLLGDSFNTPLPGLNQSVPVPSTVVLATSPGLGIPQPVKSRALGAAQSGRRATMCWAGRASVDLATSLRSTDLLSYLGAFDYAQDQAAFASHAYVPDTTDINGNGLCSDLAQCPSGSELVPDYGAFTTLAFQPRRQQKLRTEVIVPKIPSTFTTVLSTVVQADRTLGILPVGFSSQTAGAAGGDGLRAVPNATVRSGAPYNGLEASQPGVWVLALNAAGTAFSGRLVIESPLPTSVRVRSLLPAPVGATYSAAARTFSPGPTWSAAASAGGELARVSLTGSEVRHTLYFAVADGAGSVAWPSVPSMPGVDPAAEASAGLEVIVVDLVPGTSVEGLFDFSGVNLGSWATAVDGYSRADR